MKKYISHYGSFRALLQFLTYGCFHKSHFKQRYRMSDRTYENHLARARMFLPKDKLHEFRHQRHVISSIRGDTYYSCENFLIRSYQVKTLQPTPTFYQFLLLQIFGASARPLSINEIWDHPAFSRPLPRALSSAKEDSPALKLDDSTIRRYLKELEELELLVSTTRDRELFFSCPDNPLSGLTAEELNALRYAIGFYKNVSLLSVPGYYLEDTLEAMYPKSPRSFVPCQFVDNTFTRILDDELIDTILDALRQNENLRFSYHSQRPKGRAAEYIVRPCRIMTDFTGGSRQYLIGWGRAVNAARITLMRFRLDRMQALQLIAPVIPEKELPAHAKKRHVLTLRFSFDNAAEKERLQKRILEKCPDARFDFSETGSFLCTIETTDIRSFHPWIRTFFPQVEVLEDSTGNTRANIAKDIREALKNYGESIP